jgi:hypothetical protein
MGLLYVEAILNHNLEDIEQKLKSPMLNYT